MAPLTHVAGEVAVPGDKSISHRALILGALGATRTRIRGILRSHDVESTAGVLRALGVNVPALAGDMNVAGRGMRGLRAPEGDVDCGNSGTTARLMAGVVAGLPVSVRFTGDQSLSRRPMGRVTVPLRAMGARVESSEGERLPMTVHGGQLHDIEFTSEVASAQVKSALLLAALVARVSATVHEPEPSRDHTERMLQARGVDVRVAGRSVSLDPVESLASIDVNVPGDPSSAAFFAALAALAQSGELVVRDACMNPTRTGFLETLRAMGGHVHIENSRVEGGEPIGDVRVTPASLRATRIDAAQVPAMIDELPLVAILAARAEGETVIGGAAELRVKESDRIAAMVQNLRAVGADAEEQPDGLIVRGSDAPLKGRVITHGDHRIAMAFGVLGALQGNEIEIDDPDCVAVSFPGFWEELRRVTA
ncbi:MAG: 3-phosphoshikimate 1-carboxyvinyltransferase [Gemmatimonadetes bacterium]|nr:3-phosphoshikimate 1-carboxyvinyltransferase [Gemmatimonadota bacterium]